MICARCRRRIRRSERVAERAIDFEPVCCDCAGRLTDHRAAWRTNHKRDKGENNE